MLTITKTNPLLIFLFVFLGSIIIEPVFCKGVVHNAPTECLIKDEIKELKPGIKLHTVQTTNNRGPIVAYVLEVDLANKNISIKAGLPDKDKIKVKDTLTNIVKSHRAFAGINANYFDVKAGNPLGTLIADNEWIVGPVYNRAALGISKDNEVFIDKVMLIGNVTVYRGFRKKELCMFFVDGLNIPYDFYKGVGLFTSNWGKELILPENKVARIVKGGRINKIEEDVLEIKIPSNGYALIAREDYVLDFLEKGDRLKIEWLREPDWSLVTEAISGGPYLLKEGMIFIDEKEENFRFSKNDTYAPRSAVGIGKNNNLFLIAVDGRNNNHSVGLSLYELADLLKKLEITDAINLDGGGSTTLVVEGKVVNKLSDRHERKISNGLLIFYK